MTENEPQVEVIDPMADAIPDPIQVRLATFQDAPIIHEISRMGYEAHDGHFPDAEYPYILHYIIEQISNGFCWVVQDEGRVIGVSMVAPKNWPWNRQVFFYENTHLYVLPNWRGTGAADKLVEAMKALANEKQVQLILNFTYGTDFEVVKGFMAKHGMQLLGGNFLYTPLQKDE